MGHTPPYILTKLARNAGLSVQRCVAANPTTLEADLHFLSWLGDLQIYQNLALNTSTPMGVLSSILLATTDDLVRQRVLHRTDISEEIRAQCRVPTKEEPPSTPATTNEEKPSSPVSTNEEEIVPPVTTNEEPPCTFLLASLHVPDRPGSTDWSWIWKTPQFFPSFSLDLPESPDPRGAEIRAAGWRILTSQLTSTVKTMMMASLDADAHPRLHRFFQTQTGKGLVMAFLSTAVFLGHSKLPSSWQAHLGELARELRVGALALATDDLVDLLTTPLLETFKILATPEPLDNASTSGDLPRLLTEGDRPTSLALDAEAEKA
jgi:hypothetical protein